MRYYNEPQYTLDSHQNAIQSAHRRFNRAFRKFIATDTVPAGYIHIGTGEALEAGIRPRFQSQPFEVDGVWYKLVKFRATTGEWTSRAILSTPTWEEIEAHS